MKTVNYQGKEYEVEDWVNYIAMDKDGDIFGYELEPKIRSGTFLPKNNDVPVLLGNIAEEWKKSLVKL